MSEERKKLEITTEEELKLKNNAPDKMPLNPTQQGWSGQEVRRRLSKVITGNEDSILALLKDRFVLLDEIVENIEENKLDKMDATGEDDFSSISDAEYIRVYGIKANGTEGTVKASRGQIDFSVIPIRTAGGQINVPIIPIGLNHSASKGYIDSEINKIKDGVYVADSADKANIADRSKKDGIGRVIEEHYGASLKITEDQDENGQQRIIHLVSPTQKTLFTTTIEFLYATVMNGGLMASGDKQKLDGLWALFQNQDPDFLTFLNALLSAFEENPQGIDLVVELENKTDKAETRLIGSEHIIREGGRVVETDNPHCNTKIIYDGDVVFAMIETYKADNKTYKTTIIRDVNNKIIETKKEQI